MRQLTITQTITTRESASVNRYLTEISKLDLITPEEETRLAQSIRQGDQSALDRLTKANLRFVVSVAKQYQFRGLSLPDLINEGNLGLIKAAKRYDETKGFKFISYAVWWIRQGIMQALNEQARLVRLPGNRVGLNLRALKAFSQLEQEHERAPSAEELAEELQISPEEVLVVNHLNFPHQSLNAPLGEGNEGCLADILEDGNIWSTDRGVAHTQSLKTEIDRCLGSLVEKQKQILCYFFGIGIPEALSLDEIGKLYHLTPERVRQIKDKAIGLLRASKKSHLLKSYLGG